MQSPYSQRKIVRRHSNFPMSCFDLIFNHPDVTSYNKIRCYEWMTDPSLSRAVLNSNWIVFTSLEALRIPGHVVQHCLTLNGSFTVSIVDAIMVLWNYLDEYIYNHYQGPNRTHKQWRHFLPASFAEVVNDKCDYLNSDAIRSSFIGDHITYDVEDYQKIILPVFGNGGTWACYFWDFRFKTITVLDPVLMKSSPRKAKEKHHDIVFELHKALFACIDHFFFGWDIKPDGWDDVYLTDIDRRCKAQNSGLYAVHYARSFRGAQIVFNLKEPHQEPNLSAARGEIAYQMFRCGDNKGYEPNDLLEIIGHRYF